MKRRTPNEHEEYLAANGRDYLCEFRPQAGGGYLVRCPEMPPMVAFGETLEVARLMATEELVAWLDTVECARSR